MTVADESFAPPVSKAAAPPKDITTIDNGHEEVLVFEGFMDFLSYLTLKGHPASSLIVVVLNSVANLDKAVPFLQWNRSIHLFLDRDEAGRKATAEIVRRCPQSEVIDQSGFYLGYKDVNDYLRAKQRNGEKQAENPPRHVPSVRPAPGKPGRKIGGK